VVEEQHVRQTTFEIRNRTPFPTAEWKTELRLMMRTEIDRIEPREHPPGSVGPRRIRSNGNCAKASSLRLAHR
jgi:hypothetical protein